MKRWDYEQDLMLRICLEDGGTYKHAAKALGCSVDAITNRCRITGYVSGQSWTDDMLDALRYGYGRYPDDMLAATFGKTTGALRHVVARLGLRRTA